MWTPASKGYDKMAKRDSVDARIAAGVAAWKTVKNEDRWSGWAPVCDSLQLLSSKAMKLAATNAAKGKAYSLHFNALLKDNDLSDIPPTTRAAAIKCGHHLRLIEHHRATLRKGDFATYLRLTHPQSMWAVIKPLTLTAEEKAATAQAKQEREDEKKRKEAEAADLTSMVGEEIADLVHATQPDKLKAMVGRGIKLVSPRSVVLTGYEEPPELASILVEEYEIDNVGAYALIAELRRRFAPPPEPEAETDDPDPEAETEPKRDAGTDPDGEPEPEDDPTAPRPGDVIRVVLGSEEAGVLEKDMVVGDDGVLHNIC